MNEFQRPAEQSRAEVQIATQIKTANVSAQGQSQGATPAGATLEALMHIPVSVKIVLGETKMSISRLVNLKQGETVVLDRKVGEPVDVMVNDRVVAKGEIVILDDDGKEFGVSLTEIVSPM